MDETIMDKKKEFISVWVRDPRVQKEDSWHAYVDYEICVHTNSMCFTKKTSCVRRRYREFAWLRQRLQDNAVLISLPDLPPKSPFFSASNVQHVEQRCQGLQEFLENFQIILRGLFPMDIQEYCILNRADKQFFKNLLFKGLSQLMDKLQCNSQRWLFLGKKKLESRL
ncbi:sorting nexin-10B isoform X1 [Chiloscyllium punctatum]|uniref:sorting nexin-10B isoform X1 n=1 Tax=Chiloscyllium punctatum TaxID=137246 RepID=UPI003B63F750